jgi:hypothetical protein
VAGNNKVKKMTEEKKRKANMAGHTCFPPYISLCHALAASSGIMIWGNSSGTIPRQRGQKRKKQKTTIQRNKRKKKITSIKRSGSVERAFFHSLYFSLFSSCNIYTADFVSDILFPSAHYFAFSLLCNAIVIIISFQMDLIRSIIVVVPVCIQPKTRSAGKETENPQASSPVSCRPNLQPFYFNSFLFLFSTVVAVAANDQLMNVTEPNGTSNVERKKRNSQRESGKVKNKNSKRRYVHWVCFVVIV